MIRLVRLPESFRRVHLAYRRLRAIPLDVVLPIIIACFILGLLLSFEPWKKGVLGDIALFQLFGRLVADGDVPYRDFFDHKTPLINYINASGALTSDALNVDYIVTARALSLLFAVIGGVGLYFLCRFASLRPAAAFAGAIAFFAFDLFDLYVALGLEPKLLSGYIGIVALLVAYRSRWFAAGVLSALAFLTWQPAAVFLLGVLARALLVEGKRSWRPGALAMAGGLAPVALLLAYFAIVGAVNEFWFDTFVFNRTYVENQFTWSPPIDLIRQRVDSGFLSDRWFFLVGVIGFVAWLAVFVVQMLRRKQDDAAKDAAPVAVVSLGVLAYSYVNFTTEGDVMPFLPWIAFWIAWLIDRLARAATPIPIFAPVAALAVMIYGYHTILDQRPFVTIDDGRAFVADIEQRAELEDGDPVYMENEAWYLLLSGREHLSRYYYTRSQADAYAQDREGIDAALLRPIREEQPKLIVLSRQNWNDSTKWSSLQRLYAPLLFANYHLIDPASLPEGFSLRAEFWARNEVGESAVTSNGTLLGLQGWQSSIVQQDDGFLVSSDAAAYSAYQISLPGLSPAVGQPYTAVVWVKGTESSFGEKVTIILREEAGNRPQTTAVYRLTNEWQPLVVTRQIATPGLATLSIHVLKQDGTGPGDAFLVDDAELGTFVAN